MKKVLITGADGFIGSHLTEMLVAKGYHVKALSQYNSFNNWGWLENVNCKKDIEIISGDIRDLNYCKSITKNIFMYIHNIFMHTSHTDIHDIHTCTFLGR